MMRAVFLLTMTAWTVSLLLMFFTMTESPLLAVFSTLPRAVTRMPPMMAMPARWVTWAVLAAAAFGLTEVDVPPGAAVAEKLASLFPGVTDALLSVGNKILEGAGRFVGGGPKGEAGTEKPRANSNER